MTKDNKSQRVPNNVDPNVFGKFFIEVETKIKETIKDKPEVEVEKYMQAKEEHVRIRNPNNYSINTDNYSKNF